MCDASCIMLLFYLGVEANYSTRSKRQATKGNCPTKYREQRTERLEGQENRRETKRPKTSPGGGVELHGIIYTNEPRLSQFLLVEPLMATVLAPRRSHAPDADNSVVAKAWVLKSLG